ncbi:MAG: hypothetical protein HFI16_03270 [Lachnospiraceae bacterium]|nr:hypothetical protein [Lachnospiraceae bacterium]
MNFKEAYRQWNEAVVPDRMLTDRLLKKAGKRTGTHMFRSWYRTAAAILLFCAVFSFSMPVLAAHVEPVYQFLYLLSPKAAQYFMPVQMSSEDQGIRMEVVSACVHEDTAKIYITMEDLEGDRIDGTTDLYDSYSIHRPFNSVGTCERAGYDSETGKVSFLITLKEREEDWSKHPIEGDKVTFSVQEFLSRKAKYEDIVIPLNLADVPPNPETRKADLHGYGGAYELYGIGETTDVLLPNVSMDLLPDHSVTLTAWGYQNGMLHIQTSLGNTKEHDNHGCLWLENANGKQDAAYSISFWDETDPEHPVTYQEEVFDLSMEELADCTLHGYYVISGQKTEGSWKVTFPLE